MRNSPKSFKQISDIYEVCGDMVKAVDIYLNELNDIRNMQFEITYERVEE